MLDIERANEQMSKLLDQLGEREREVLTLRFGLKGGPCRTLDDVGKHLNVTGEQVRQIEANALRKLRHPSFSRLLRDCLV